MCKVITELVCSCGTPLSITTNEGDWALGHFDKICGPIISHKDFSKVLEKYRELAENNFDLWRSYNSVNRNIKA